MPVCPNCRIESDTTSDTCPICGAPLPKTVQNEEPQSDAENQGSEKTKPSVFSKLLSIPKKTLLISCIIGILVIALVITLFSFAINSSGTKYALYIKDKEIFYSDFSKSGTWQMTSNLDSSGEADNSILADSSYELNYTTFLSKDGKILFFPDRVGKTDNGISLYYRYVDKPKKEAVMIDDDIYGYTVNDSASLVTYAKISDDEYPVYRTETPQRKYTLYQYDMKKGDKEKLSGNIKRFTASDNGKKIIYQDTDDNIYLWISGKNTEKIGNQVESVSCITKDLKTVYYVKDDTLYKVTEGKEKKRIVDNAINVIKVYDTGEVYFINSKGELCYLNGQEIKKVAASLDNLLFDVADSSPVIIYTADQKRYIAVGAVTTEITTGNEKYFSFRIDSDGKTIYFHAQMEGNDYGNLYKITVSKGKAKEPELYDTDVYDSSLRFLTAGQLMYYKNHNDDTGCGDLYINKAKIDQDVDPRSILYHEKSKKLLYCTVGENKTLKIYEIGRVKEIANDVYDYDILPSGHVVYLGDYDLNSYQGDLYLYKGGNPKKIDSDVTAIIRTVEDDYRGLNFNLTW